jgi:hypothetical protein
VQSTVVVSIHVFRGGDVDFLNSMPRAAGFNQLGLAKAYHGIRQCVAGCVADGASRGVLPDSSRCEVNRNDVCCLLAPEWCTSLFSPLPGGIVQLTIRWENTSEAHAVLRVCLGGHGGEAGHTSPVRGVGGEWVCHQVSDPDGV